MLVNEQFLTAVKDKALHALVVCKRLYETRTYMYLCLEQKNKYTNDINHVFVEADTDFRIDNYSGANERQIKAIIFHCGVLALHGESHIMTFLKAIKKTSNVKFRIVAYNGCEYWQKAGFVAHQLYGYIDDKCYLLSEYVGPENTCSPIQ